MDVMAGKLVEYLPLSACPVRAKQVSHGMRFQKESTNQHPALERCDSLGRVIWFVVEPTLICTEDAVACDPRGAKGGN